MASLMREVRSSLSPRGIVSDRVLKVAQLSWNKACKVALLYRDSSGLGSCAILTNDSKAFVDSCDTLKSGPSAWLVIVLRKSQ